MLKICCIFEILISLCILVILVYLGHCQMILEHLFCKTRRLFKLLLLIKFHAGSIKICHVEIGSPEHT